MRSSPAARAGGRRSSTLRTRALLPSSSPAACFEGGADPNATFTNEYAAMSAVYGGAGVRHDPALTRLLLEAGADPNDGESLYHATEAPETACLFLLLEHGARPEGRAGLAHAIDDDKVRARGVLLGAGAPNEARWALLVHAVRRGCGEEMVRLLAQHGAQLDRRGGEWSTPPEQYRTADQNASWAAATTSSPCSQRSGRTPTSPRGPRRRRARARRAAGHACARGAGRRRSGDAHPRGAARARGRDRRRARPELLRPRRRRAAGNAAPPRLVGRKRRRRRSVLARGADPVARSGADYDTPLAWAALGSQHHGLPGREYVAVFELLLAAGARLEPRFTEVAEGPLAGWLQERA